MDSNRKSRRKLIVLMTLSFVVGLLVVPVVFVCIQVVEIAQSMSIENQFATRETKLSDKVRLLATSGTNVMLADEDGFGLVYGDVVLAGYGRDEHTLTVVYIPRVKGTYTSDDALSQLGAAEVDLASGQVTERATVTQRELTHLQGVFAFMNNQ